MVSGATADPKAAAAEGLPTAVIELRSVTKTFAGGNQVITALDGLSFSAKAGRLTGLVGPDGAGKTTLMRILCGLLKPDQGSSRVLGWDPVGQAAHIQANVGYMPQRFGLYEDLSVSENLDLYADLRGLAGPQRQARFDRLTEFTGLGPFRDRLAGKLSGGMKQKLGLACTLVHSPQLLLLDEPSVGVDPLSRRELWQMVHSLVDEGASVIWATAYLDEAERCHDVILLNEGRLLAAGPPEDFSKRVDGQTFSVRVPAEHRRAAVHELQAMPFITDAIIKGRDVRVLLAADTPADELTARCRKLDIGVAEVTKVAPIFEDSFISLLKETMPDGDIETRQSQHEAELPQGGQSAAVAPRQQQGPEDRPAAIAGQQANSVIEVEGLVRKFGAFTAVDKVSFSVRRAEIFGLLGPNGAGKSTSFKMLCGLLPPTDGKALVLGIDLRRAAAIARGRIGYMAQKFSLYGIMTVRQNLQFFASAYGLSGSGRQEKIDAALEEFGLTRFAASISESLPLGYKQRLALACALMHRPGILFLDEPTSGVDPIVRREFWARINAMAAAGVTVMVTTHFMEEAEYCDRVGIIYRGQLIALDTPEALKSAHASTSLPDPTLEDAFIQLIEQQDRELRQ